MRVIHSKHLLTLIKDSYSKAFNICPLEPPVSASYTYLCYLTCELQNSQNCGFLEFMTVRCGPARDLETDL